MEIDRFFSEHLNRSELHKCFYHFTDSRNLESIRRHGLLSMRECKRRNIAVAAPGGNQWSLDADISCGADAYVHLCFTRSHGMAHTAQQTGRIQGVVWMKIDPTVIMVEGAMITLDVANKSGVVRMRPSVALEKLDLDVIYKRTEWRDPAVMARLQAARKCEILIPTGIFDEHILSYG